MKVDARWMAPLGLALLLGCTSPEKAALEARTQVPKLFDSAANYFMKEQPTTELLTSHHQCPNDGQPSGSAGITPPLSVRCALGDDGQCVPGGTGPGSYAPELWTDNPVWKAMNFGFEGPHRFHYDFRWAHGAGGYGECEFTIQAFADLDNDGTFSTYERSGYASKQGVDAAIGMYIEHELE